MNSEGMNLFVVLHMRLVDACMVYPSFLLVRDSFFKVSRCFSAISCE